MRLLAALGAMMAMLGAVPAAAEPAEVMVLGTYHFGNPGLDLVNMAADDVTTPKRQAELEALAEALATFRPNRIMIESLSKSPDLIDARFATFTPASLATEKNESVQIGYRLAHRLGLGRVYAIDEQPGPGEPDYFPFDKVMAYARAHGKEQAIASLMAQAAQVTKATEAKQARATIAELLIDHNVDGAAASGIDPYYELLRIGGADEQPGADLNAMWYLRNAKIFAKLMTVAEPGDRILVIYGSGHNYWLRHFASQTPGFTSVDPVPYLRRAASR
jgi:hypothetical protein